MTDSRPRLRFARGLALAAGLLSGAAPTHAEEPLLLVDVADGSLPLAGHIAQLHDPDGRWTLDDVRRPELAARFAAVPSSGINHGLSDQTYWYRLALQTPGDLRSVGADWVLSVGIPTLDRVDIHVTTGGHTETTLAGDLRPVAPNLLNRVIWAVPLRMTPSQRVEIHVRVHTVGRHQLLLVMAPLRNHLRFASMHDRRSSAVNGILLVMAAYNLLIFFVIRDRAYFYYVLYLLSSVALGLVYSGDVRRLEVTSQTVLEMVSASGAMLIGITTLFSTLFGRAFLQTRVHLPRVHRLTTVLAILAAASAAVYPVVGFLVSARIGIVAFLLSGFAMFAIAAYLAAKGQRAARFYLVAFASLTFALTLSALNAFGAVPTIGFLLWGPSFCLIAGVTLFSLALADRLSTERRERERFARLKQYLPSQVANMVIGAGDTRLLEPRRRNVTVLVMDLRGFTPFSETSAPEDVMAVLREFYETMGAIVEQHQGTVEHFAGDSMLVFFNAPLELSQPERHGIEAALAMREAFEPLRRKWLKNGHELGLGIGVANGFATTGAIGFSGRSQYAAIGAVTNLASRLCSGAAHGEILTTARVLAAVEGLVDAESAGEQAIRGISRPVQVSRVLCLRCAAPAADLAPAPQGQATTP